MFFTYIYIYISLDFDAFPRIPLGKRTSMWKKTALVDPLDLRKPWKFATFFGVGSSLGALCSFGTASARLDAEQKWEVSKKWWYPLVI